MLTNAVDHLIYNVLPAAAGYEAAEQELTVAYLADCTPTSWEDAGREAKRHAAQLATAIDGRNDRCMAELGLSKTRIRSNISALCTWPGGGALRDGALERVRAVTNAYKHFQLDDRTLPIWSEEDVLIVGMGFGEEAFGAGKPGIVEVVVREKDDTEFKFMADAPVVICAWFKFLSKHGAVIGSGPYSVCGLQVHPELGVKDSPS
jgi:hypothetical protein